MEAIGLCKTAYQKFLAFFSEIQNYELYISLVYVLKDWSNSGMEGFHFFE